MALIGNRSVILKSPGRFLNGTANAKAGVGVMRSAFNMHGMMRNAYEAYDPKSATPVGHLAPSAWVPPKTAGGMSSRNVTTLTAAPTGLAVGGITTTGAAYITIDFATATGGLIASGTGSAALTFTVADLLLTASINGVGSAAFSIATNSAQLGAEASGDGSASFSFTATCSQVLPLNDTSPLRTGIANFAVSGSLIPYAIGSMSGGTEGGGDVLTSDAIANAVLALLNATTIPVNVAEINNVPVSGAGVTGNEWGPA